MAEKDKLKMSRFKKITFILFTLIFLSFTIVLLFELGLYMVKYDSHYARLQHFSTEQASWWTCDNVNGPRYVKGKAGKEDSAFLQNEAWYYHRLKIVNSQGYHDKDEFSEISPLSDSLRILLDGDSFTWGASSDLDSSYVEVMENDLKQKHSTLVWNTGIPGTGTNHAIFTTRKFLPLQKSNIVILGFYTGNDFSDNLIPFTKMVFTKQASCYNLWDYDPNFRPFEISTKEAVRKATGTYPAEELSFLQIIFARSRFLSFASDMVVKLGNRFSGKRGKILNHEYEATSNYLKELDHYTRANNAKLIVLVIPTVRDIKEKGSYYKQAVSILDSLSIPYVETVDLYTEKDYVNGVDGHWNNRGHVLTGHALSNYLLTHINSR